MRAVLAGVLVAMLVTTACSGSDERDGWRADDVFFALENLDAIAHAEIEWKLDSGTAVSHGAVDFAARTSDFAFHGNRAAARGVSGDVYITPGGHVAEAVEGWLWVTSEESSEPFGVRPEAVALRPWPFAPVQLSLAQIEFQARLPDVIAGLDAPAVVDLGSETLGDSDVQHFQFETDLRDRGFDPFAGARLTFDVWLELFREGEARIHRLVVTAANARGRGVSAEQFTIDFSDFDVPGVRGGFEPERYGRYYVESGEYVGPDDVPEAADRPSTTREQQLLDRAMPNSATMSIIGGINYYFAAVDFEQRMLEMATDSAPVARFVDGNIELLEGEFWRSASPQEVAAKFEPDVAPCLWTIEIVERLMSSAELERTELEMGEDHPREIYTAVIDHPVLGADITVWLDVRWTDGVRRPNSFSAGECSVDFYDWVGP